MGDLQKEVKLLFESNSSIEAVEQELLQKGYLKQDVELAVHKFASTLRDEKSDRKNTESRKFFLKELLDRIGYGLGGEQYITILFFLSGATLPLIAVVNGLKAMLTTISSTFIREYSTEKGIDKRMISYAGILYGYCFIMMATAVLLHSPILFLSFILVSALCIVSYGEFYQQFMRDSLSAQKEGLVGFVYKYGLLITVISLTLAAVLMDRFELISLNFSLFGKQISFSFLSYLAVFEAAALFFIVSGYVVSQLSSSHTKKGILREIFSYVPEYIRKIRSDFALILKNRPLIILTLATSLTGFVQMLGNSLYWIFIYTHFSGIGFGPFLNVAMISILALITSLITPLITRENTKAYGKYPMLIFGTFLMAIMPLAFHFNPNLVSIGMGTILGVMGAAIVGIANGMLCAELVSREIKAGFFGVYTLLTLLPYILLIPLGAYLLNLLGISRLFLLLALVLLLLVVPLYFIMMLSPKLKMQSFN